MENPKLTLNAFLNELITKKFNDTLLVSITDYAIIDSNLFKGVVIKDHQEIDNLDLEKNFDFIVSETTLGMRKKAYKIGDSTFKIKENWTYILKILELQKDDGISMFLVEPSILFSVEGRKFINILKSLHFYVLAVFNTPKDILVPYATIRPIMITVGKIDVKQVFVGEIESNSYKFLVDNFYNRQGTSNIELGEYTQLNDFTSFDQYIAKKQIEALETQYNQYKMYPLKDFIKEINTPDRNKKLVEKENSIYLPKLGNSNPVVSLSELIIKEQNYYQVVLKDTVNNYYLQAMFKSQLGKLILDSNKNGTYINQLNRSSIPNMVVPIPNLETQLQVKHTLDKLEILKQTISVFDKEIAINPTSSQQILDRIDQIVEVLGKLTDADLIRNIIRKGESKELEFKQTFSYDIRKGSKEKYIEETALKTIVGFLNTNGGTLLIGVTDNGEINGINFEIEELYKNIDKYLLHFKNRIKERIGEQFYPLINYNISNIDDKLVLVVKCEESVSPCFLDGNAFYVRTNPSTDKLDGQKLIEYVNIHFNQTLKEKI